MHNLDRPRLLLVEDDRVLGPLIAELLADDFAITSDIWSATSLTELRREGMKTERWNLLNPEQPSRISYIAQCLEGRVGPLVVATDYMKIVADQIRPYVNDRRFVALGTDGFGRSDTRESLRRCFEVDRHFIVVAALKALADDGAIAACSVREALQRYGIDSNKPDPAYI